MTNLAFVINAQTNEDKQISSLIVALDIRSNVNTYWNTYEIDRALEGLLEATHVSPDYMSGVYYGIKEYAQTPENFSTLVWKPSDAKKGFYDLLKYLHDEIPVGTYYSITSFAKPYSLMVLKDKQETNRTYMAILTDAKYNGNDDYYGEARYVKKDFSNKGLELFKRDIRRVQTNYFCQFINETKIWGGYIQLFEFIPLQQYFALEAVLDFPHTVIAKRGKTEYTLNIPTKIVENPNYDIKKIELNICYNRHSGTPAIVSPGQSLVIPLDKSKIADAYIKLNAWIKLNDGIYNNTVLHPYGSDLQGAVGLNRIIKIEKEENAKILGLCPLPDFLFKIAFWTDSQTIAATGWGIIFILLIIILVLIIVYKNNIYKVKDSDIKEIKI